MLYIHLLSRVQCVGPCVAEDMSMALKSMSIEKLVALKGQIEAMLSSKVVEQRRALESELSKLGRFEGGKSTSKVARGYGAVAPKYRNPENPTETWAGRGLKPRWLTAAIKTGRKAEDFLIAGAAASKAMGAKRPARRESRRRNNRIPPSCDPPGRHGQGQAHHQALRVLRNLDNAGRGPTPGASALEGMSLMSHQRE
jgi:DNA-binding protein H-NS